MAVAVATAGRALGWAGVDWPAQLDRIELVHRQGLTLWDSQWYGGHWLASYSALVAPVAAVVGTGVLTVAAAGAAAACFARLARPLGPGGGPASLVFAVGVAVPVAIGQLTFLVGEAVGMACALCLARRRWGPGAALAVVATLASPLAGAFVAVAALGVAAAWRGRRHGGWRGPTTVAVAAIVPIAAVAHLFPGDGPMPYPVLDWLWEVAVAAGAWIAVGRRPVLRWGITWYVVALTGSELVSSAVGGNAGRLEDVVALPLAVGVLWRHRVALALLVVPLVASQWSPAWSAMTDYPAQAWTYRGFYRPLVAWVEGQGGPLGRVEVVPTVAHYEASDVAPTLALARGWERQLDIADNPIFYRPGRLDGASYRAWLLANGVRWVALPAAPLDSAGRAEGRLLAAGVPGLAPVWSDPDWRVWAVEGSTGLAPPGTTVLEASGPRLDLRASHRGPVVVRVRWSAAWRVESGDATLRPAPAPGRWLEVDVGRPGDIDLRVGWP